MWLRAIAGFDAILDRFRKRLLNGSYALACFLVPLVVIPRLLSTGFLLMITDFIISKKVDGQEAKLIAVV